MFKNNITQHSFNKKLCFLEDRWHGTWIQKIINK